MAVLVIHLDKEETEKRKEDLRGLELAIRLYKEYEAEQPVVITSPKGEAVRFQGSAFFSLVFKSPLTGGMMIASSALAPSPHTPWLSTSASSPQSSLQAKQ